MRSSPSIERTANELRLSSAAHVERWLRDADLHGANGFAYPAQFLRPHAPDFDLPTAFNGAAFQTLGLRGVDSIASWLKDLTVLDKSQGG